MKPALIGLLVLATSAQSAFAAVEYIDPGSGSAIMAAIIGAFVAVGITVKTYWYKLVSLFKGGKEKSEE